MRFWRSVRERTEIIILVVWTSLVGLCSQRSRLSPVHLMLAALRPGEYLKPGAVPLLRPIIRASEGPMRFSPGDVEWQAAQFASKYRRPSGGPAGNCCAGTSTNKENKNGLNPSNLDRVISTSPRVAGALARSFEFAPHAATQPSYSGMGDRDSVRGHRSRKVVRMSAFHPLRTFRRHRRYNCLKDRSAS